MAKIISLSELSSDELFEAFSAAFSDYEITLNRAEHDKMLLRRGFNPELSFGAIADGRLVSFTCNGIGFYNGNLTAYDTGTGTLKEYRGKGLATEVFKESLPVLKKAGIRQYLLEVLQHNQPAVKVYMNLGFKVTREFNYFVTDKQNVQPPVAKIPAGLSISEIKFNELGDVYDFWDYAPSWQNSFDAILRKPEDFRVFAAMDGGRAVAYGIIEPESGDITQLAVHPEYRRVKIGSAILAKLVSVNNHSHLKLINSEVHCTALTTFCECAGLTLSGKQFEMILPLDEGVVSVR